MLGTERTTAQGTFGECGETIRALRHWNDPVTVLIEDLGHSPIVVSLSG